MQFLRTRVLAFVALAAASGLIAPLFPLDRTAAASAQTFADAPIGYGAAATGGAGRPDVTVTSLADSGPGTLRAALATGGNVRFKAGLSGRITAASPLLVPSNTTIDGRGAAITITGRGLQLVGVRNVILRNLTLEDIADPANPGAEDAIRVMDGSSDLWFDHLTLRRGSDGLLDITRASTNVTISWSRFEQHQKTALLGHASPDGTPAMVKMTVHHNVFVGTGERNPMMRHGDFHVFNNLDLDWTNYAMRADCGARALVEGNIFDPATDKDAAGPKPASLCDSTRAPALVARSNLALDGAMITTSGQVQNPAYPYTLDPADSVLRNNLLTYAGALGPDAVSSPPTSTTSTTTTTSTTSTTTTSTTTTTAPSSTTTTAPELVVPPATPLPAPLVTLRWNGTGRLRIEWTSVSGASSYNWSIRRCDGGAIVGSGASTGSQRRVDGLSGSNCYEGWVQVVYPDRSLGATGRARMPAGATTSVVMDPLPTA